MKTFTKKGFTLIELLVVVLIIGILAAVALPQYEKAVNKTRVTEALITLKALTDAQEVYFLANNKYTNNLDELDISVQISSSYYSYLCDTRLCLAVPKTDNLPLIEFNMQQFYGADANEFFLGKHWCIARSPEQDKKEAICKTLGTFSTEMRDMGAPGNYYQM